MESTNLECKIVAETLQHLNLGQYEEAFKEQALTDALVTEGLASGEDAFLKDVIPTLGHRMLFKKDFCNRAGVHRSTTHDTTQLSQQINNGAVSVTAGESTSATIMSVAKAYGWKLKAKLAVWRKIKSECVKSFNDVSEDGQLAAETYLEDEELEDLIDEAEEAAIDRFDQFTNTLADDYDKRTHKQTLQQELEKRRRQVKAVNEEKKQAAKALLEKQAVEIIKQFVTWIRESLGKRVVSREDLEEKFQEGCPKVKQDFENQCGHFKCYDAKLFQRKIQAAVDALWTELENRNHLFEKRTVSLGARLVGMYKDQMIVTLEDDEFDQVHETCIAKIEETVKNAPDLDDQSKKVCWESFRRQQIELRANEIDNMIARRAIFKKFVNKYTELMELVCETAVNRAQFEQMEEAHRKNVIKGFAAKLKKVMKDQRAIERHIDRLTVRLEEDRDVHLEIFETTQQENEIAVKAVLFEAKQYYSSEMKKKLQHHRWLEPTELQRVHLQVMKHALEISQVELQLTPKQSSALSEALMVLYKKYEEDNERGRPNKAAAIGIDLGTTYSCVGVYINGGVKIIPEIKIDHKFTTIPSYVAFRDDNIIDVGLAAKSQAFKIPTSTIFDAKRLIGRKFSNKVVQKDMKLWPFEVVNQDGDPRIRVKGKTYRPEEISAKVLAKLKEMAETYLGQPVAKAVITVPAYFGDAQRKATKDAAEMANLDAVILNEPTAAAFAYKLHRTGDLRKNILIFDLGGGTFDVAILTVDKGAITVKAVGGDDHLGGEDFDCNMVDAIVKRVKRQHDIDLDRDLNSTDTAKKLKAKSRLRRLRTICEEQKKFLSAAPTVSIEFEALDDGFDLSEEFTREEFNLINMELFQKCIDIVAKTLEEAGMSKLDVDDIVLVGGSTRIPKVQEMLENFFDNRKSLNKQINPDEAVAWGAAYQAALMSGGQITDENARLQFKDVTAKSLGVAVYDELYDEQKMSVIIEKNTTVPCSRTTTGFSNRIDYQKTCAFEIYEGEDKWVKNNTRLGKFLLTGIPSAPRGQAKMDCIMTIDEEGVLHVEAQVVTNGKKESLRIESYTGRITPAEKQKTKIQPPFRWA